MCCQDGQMIVADQSIPLDQPRSFVHLDSTFISQTNHHKTWAPRRVLIMPELLVALCKLGVPTMLPLLACCQSAPVSHVKKFKEDSADLWTTLFHQSSRSWMSGLETPLASWLSSTSASASTARTMLVPFVIFALSQMQLNVVNPLCKKIDLS